MFLKNKMVLWEGSCYQVMPKASGKWFSIENNSKKYILVLFHHTGQDSLGKPRIFKALEDTNGQQMWHSLRNDKEVKKENLQIFDDQFTDCLRAKYWSETNLPVEAQNFPSKKRDL